MNLFRAISTNDEVTENGMPTNSTSSNFVLDMFFKMGGSRGMNDKEIISMFSRAMSENPLLATKALFYNRDVRGGQGERRSFRVMFNYLSTIFPDIAKKLLVFVPEYGRWDDLFTTLGTPVWSETTDLILSALKNGDKLCAKWMPRENKKFKDIADILMEDWELSPKQYRKLISGNTQVVENLMCSNKWGKVNYNHVPSKAVNQYRNAFSRHDPERFVAWLESLKKPESGNKIHAGAIFPHDIVKKYINGGRQDEVLETQWKAQPNYLPEGRRILPVCDVSGSMSTGDGLPMEVCISLGIYLAERNVGPFKDGFITFSNRPELQILSGKTLHSRVSQLHRAHWEMNTNLESVFSLILGRAIQFKLPEEDMPTDILILSDMQFDQAMRNPADSVIRMIRSDYLTAGYEIPNVIFWNLRTSNGIPVKFDEKGTALVSGFSPSIMKSLLGGELTPEFMMLKVLNSERYSKILI